MKQFRGITIEHVIVAALVGAPLLLSAISVLRWLAGR